MLLADPRDVVTTMGISSDSGVIGSATNALNLAFPMLETLLETRLAAGYFMDYFSYVGPIGDTAQNPASLRLANRYVDEDTVIVRYSSTAYPLNSATAGSVLSPSSYEVDTDKGIVYLYHPPVRGNFVYSVEYESGFSEGGEIPAHVKMLATSAAVYVLNTHPSTVANRKQNSVQNVAKTLYAYMKDMVAPHRRPRLTVEFAVLSKVL